LEKVPSFKRMKSTSKINNGNMLDKLEKKVAKYLNCFSDLRQYEKDINDIRLQKSKKLIIDFLLDKHTINYAPVGNYSVNPVVIISGKTTSGGSHDMFIDSIQKGNTFHEACFLSIFSNMKDNLFKYLEMIKLFDYLKGKVPYWNQKKFGTKKLWDELFTKIESSLASGIQLTQAFNSAVLNKDPKKRSSEPPNNIFRLIQERFGCLFNHFNISDNLELIVFLDTPSDDNRFHQIHYWDKYYRMSYPKITIISITHPSGQNSSIYNNLGRWDDIGDQRKRQNAEKLFIDAQNAICNLKR